MEDPVFFNSIAVIGLGMIGGSLVKALRKSGFDGRLTGADSNPENRHAALDSGLLNRVENDPAEAAAGAELVILAVPLGAMESVMQAIAPVLGRKTVVTDAGSVKGTVMEAARRILGPTGCTFIGGHPMSGSEKTGFSAGTPILFENAYYFLTPAAGSEPEPVERLKALARFLGALPVQIPSEEHDRLAASISHLPHLTAALLVNSFCRELPKESLKFSGGGFRDTTRIASGSATLWRDIFLHNRKALMHSLDGFIEELMGFRQLLEEENDAEIVYNLNRASIARSDLPRLRAHDESRFHRLVLDAEDRPGIIAAATGILAQNRINIKDITVDHARDQTPGAIVLSFASLAERDEAARLIEAAKICPVIPEQDGTDRYGDTA